jgi:hypothetical protein
VPRFLQESIYETAQILSKKTPKGKNECTALPNSRSIPFRLFSFNEGKNLEETLRPVFSAKKNIPNLSYKGWIAFSLQLSAS